MSRRVAAVLAAGWLAAGVAAAADFEGVVSMDVAVGGHADKPTASMTYSAKGAKVRVEPTGARAGMGGILLFDATTGVLTVLMPASKSYMVMPSDSLPTPAKAPAAAMPTKTGKTQTILGYAAEQWVAKTDTSSSEFWLTKALGGYRSVASMGHHRGSPNSAAEEMFAAQGYFPLLMIVSDQAGKERTRLTVTKVDKKSLPDSLFAPPADYTKMERPAGMPGMGGGMPPRPGPGAGAAPAGPGSHE